MLGVLYDTNTGSRMTFDTVEFKKKYTYFNNSLVDTSFVVGTTKPDASRSLQNELTCLILEAFYSNTPIALSRILAIQPSQIIMKQLQTKKGSLKVKTMQELQMESKLQSKVYISTSYGIYKIKAVSSSPSHIIIETVDCCFILTLDKPELLPCVHYLLTYTMSQGNRVIIKPEDIVWNIMNKTGYSASIDIERRVLTTIKKG